MMMVGPTRRRHEVREERERAFERIATYKLGWVLDKVGEKVRQHVRAKSRADTGQKDTDSRRRGCDRFADRRCACGKAATKSTREMLPGLARGQHGGFRYLCYLTSRRFEDIGWVVLKRNGTLFGLCAASHRIRVSTKCWKTNTKVRIHVIVVFYPFGVRTLSLANKSEELPLVIDDGQSSPCETGHCRLAATRPML